MDHEQILVSDELIAVMRDAVSKALSEGDNFVAPRHMLLALLDDATIGAPLAEVIDREKLEGAHDGHELPNVTEVPEDRQITDEQPALVRYDTLVFKDPGGFSSVWLNAEAYAVFLEGARHAEGKYLPKHLTLGFVSEARRTPAVLMNTGSEPGKISELVYSLS